MRTVIFAGCMAAAATLGACGVSEEMAAARTYAKTEVVPNLTTPEAFSSLLSDDYRSAVTPADHETYMTLFARLGAYQSSEEPACNITVMKAVKSSQVSGVCSAAAIYENSAATVQVAVRRVDDVWRVDGFNVSSPLITEILADAVKTEPPAAPAQ